MFDEFVVIQKIIAAITVGYLLGSVPFAQLAARLKGVDIFTTGSRRAGSANVFWNISRRTGVLVCAGDVAKGFLAVYIASLLNLPGLLVILAGGAAIVGHWKPVFTHFRGGDGMATLMGVTLGLTPLLALLGTLVAVLVVILIWKSHFRSPATLVSCFASILILSQYYPYFLEDQEAVFGTVILAMLVLFHNLFVQRRVTGILLSEQLDMDRDINDDSEIDENTDIGQPAPEKL